MKPSPIPTPLTPSPLPDTTIISLKNIDDEDFIFEYDKSRGNPPYIIPAGKIWRGPAYLARPALRKLIDKIITKRADANPENQSLRTSNEQLREELRNQIVIETEALQRVQKTEVERQREEVDALNVPSDLDKVLERHRERERAKEPKEEFAGLEKKRKKGDVGPEVDIVAEEKAPKPKKEVKPVPTRNEIYQYGERSLNMVIYDDEKTKKKLDRMPITKLLKEIGDPREALR